MSYVPSRLAKGLFATAALALLAACSRPQPERSETPVPPPAPTPAPPLTPPPDPVLTRADLIAAASAAAEAHATGAPYPETAARLAGRRFEARQPFGCAGPTDADSADGYVIDEARKVMTVQVAATKWSDDAWLKAYSEPEAQAEALEGFWLRRPWITTAACPATSRAITTAASAESIGLVRVFTTGGSRIARRGERPYRATVKLADDGSSPTNGFQLVLQGRVSEAAGRPVRCRSEGPDLRPVCLVSVTLERVAFEGMGGEPIAEWQE